MELNALSCLCYCVSGDLREHTQISRECVCLCVRGKQVYTQCVDSSSSAGVSLIVNEFANI